MSTSSPRFVCHVAAVREAAGETQAGLAKQVGVSRQALSLIESGRSIPSTALALRLADVLGRTVEALFALGDGASKDAMVSVHWAASDPSAAVGEGPVRGVVGRVGTRLVAHALHPADLGVADVVGDRGQRRVRAIAGGLGHDTSSCDRLFIAGCAPALSLLCEHLAKASAPLRATWIHATTAQALTALGHKEVQVAGLHFPPASAAVERTAAVRHRLTFARWQQGLVVRRGDRRAPRNIGQLARRGLRVVRREPGASANQLLDNELEGAGISLDGAHTLVARGHFGVGAAVALGAADVGVAAQHAAVAHDLAFVPLDEERFDLTFDAAFVHDPRYQRLGDILASRAFRADLDSLGGYDTTSTGSVPQSE